MFTSIDSASEARALQFFCERTARFLSGATDPYFWTHLVMQFSNFEPAVRHSVVAISALYEELQSDSGPKSAAILKQNRLALQHYNAAIRELKSTDNQPLVLLVCILFICIEFLQADKKAAIQHCKYGIALVEHVNYSWAREHLVPVFRRLSAFPFYFGEKDDFPDIAPLDDPLPACFSSFVDAESAMDGLTARTLRLVRHGDGHRFGNSRYSTIPYEQLAEQEKLEAALAQWQVLFKALDGGSPVSPPTPPSEDGEAQEDSAQLTLKTILLVRHEVCQIWLDIAFEADEMCYDCHTAAFRRIVDAATVLKSANANANASTTTPSDDKNNPTFVFETGLTPMLHFVATKCRHLDMRLEALRLIKAVGKPRENLWEANQMYALARRVIELEHGVRLDGSGYPVAPASHPGLPADEKRIRFTSTDIKPSAHIDINGKEKCGWPVGFIMRSPQNSMYLHTEFIDQSYQS